MDKFKAMFKGKKGKYMIGAIIIVLVIALFTLSRRKAYASDDSMMLSEYPSYQGMSVPQGEGGGGGSTVSGGGGSETIIVDKVNDLQGQINDQNDFMKDYASGVNSQLSALDEAIRNALLGKGANSALTNPNANVGGDNTVYGLSNQYTGGNAATGAMQPNLGYGGINYYGATTTHNQKSSIQTNVDKYKNDAGFRASEQERAQQVIKDRQAAGMDTTSQQKYLAELAKAEKAQTPAPAPKPSTSTQSYASQSVKSNNITADNRAILDDVAAWNKKQGPIGGL